MIQLVPADDDDAEFLALAQSILNGAVSAPEVRELFPIHIDNWFDHKWLGWQSRWKHKRVEELRIPLFTPNRVCSETQFIRDAKRSAWSLNGVTKPLHVQQAGRSWFSKPIDQYPKHAAFAWYSGNTTTNSVGSLMFYMSHADGYSWYASFKKSEKWVVGDETGITRRELLSFDELGRQTQSMEDRR